MSRLPDADVHQFFQLYRALQLYANAGLHVVPEVQTVEHVAQLKLEDQIKLRDALYDHPELIDSFVAENPSGLTAEELTEVNGWSRFIRGDFYVLRHLKRYSVFVSSGQPAQAYGVLGLADSIADTFPANALPVYLKAVLLPFKGHIIWDGLATYRNVTFGPGIRAGLHETYQRAKLREGLRESLPAADQPTAPASGSRPPRSKPELRSIVQGIVEASERLRPGATPLQSRTYGLLRAAAHLAESATNSPSDLQAIDEYIRALTRSYKQLVTAYEREFYGD